jgi:2-polyprenyl-3-methyl-5-hydroxy-6-metoxy-1,4-benzoquinol methylase
MKDSARGAGRGREYVLGHSNGEMDRLVAQARLIDPLTRRFFHEAGIAPGMRVLDVGSGAGDVAFLAAGLVGGTGEVVGVDRVPGALETARARAAALHLGNVSFRDGDPAELAFERPFDAVLGRYVLQFQQDPAAMLRKLAAHVRPGGVVVFHEIDWGGVSSAPPVPTFDQCCRWGHETLRRHGTETRMGTRLHTTFVAAGLPSPTMRLEALIGGGEHARPLIELVASLVATLLPEMERLGVATAAEVGVNTLVERMTAEAEATSSAVLGHYQVGAWARV